MTFSTGETGGAKFVQAVSTNLPRRPHPVEYTPRVGRPLYPANVWFSVRGSSLAGRFREGTSFSFWVQPKKVGCVRLSREEFLHG
jgi:hypothetical protein